MFKGHETITYTLVYTYIKHLKMYGGPKCLKCYQNQPGKNIIESILLVLSKQKKSFSLYLTNDSRIDKEPSE